MFCDCAIPRTAGKAPVWDTTLAVGEGERFARRGAEVFARNCAGCHGQDGSGDGPAAVALTPAPRNLTTAQFSDRSLSESLWNGVRGSSMPSWSDLPSGELEGARGLLEDDRPDGTAARSHRHRAGDGEGHLRQTVCGLPRSGTGPATVLRRRSWPRPRPTSTRSGPRRTTPRRRLTNGVRGTAMPKWGPKAHAGRALAVGPLRPVVLWQGNSGVT